MKLINIAYALTLAAAFACSSAAFAMNCACEVATGGACAECCGDVKIGFKHCGSNGNGGVTVPKSRPEPAELPAADAAAAPPAPQGIGDEAVTKPPGKSPVPDKTPGSTGKDKP